MEGYGSTGQRPQWAVVPMEEEDEEEEEEEEVGTSPNLQAERPPLVGSPRLFIRYIRSYVPYWRLLLQPQPEDAPCCGDRDPLITYVIHASCYIMRSLMISVPYPVLFGQTNREE